ncbi:Cleavage and polyadenylation specificity factor subunit 2 [Mucor velutinosus]|uniref:Cleavage and polyadenylation specificity factor subunit 2 n=1 Tax=Mucor velutinosus TaxID=708070 RepID=A0AAN7HT84_9FUNG|nr:Cleavage and polyadenylation specificity factor subunit 2 [Mucor velutinosus]
METNSVASSCMNQGETVSTHSDAIAPPSNGQCIVLESGCIHPNSRSSSNEQHRSDQMVDIAALDSHHSHTIAWQNSSVHVHVEPISGWSETTPTRTLDLSLARQFSTNMSNRMAGISTSMQRMVTRPTATPTANAASLSILRMPSTAISLPPTYKLYSEKNTSDQQLRQKIAELTRLEACYRSNPGAVIYEFMWGDPVDGTKGIAWKDMCNTCFLLQFTGFYMIFWILLLGIAGCLSLFVEKLPGPILLLWLPILLFLAGVYMARKRYRKQLQDLEELEVYVEEGTRKEN